MICLNRKICFQNMIFHLFIFVAFSFFLSGCKSIQEADEYHEIKGEFKIVRVNNPYGYIRIHPSKDKVLRVQIDKFASDKKKLKTIEPFIKHHGDEVWIEMFYNDGGGNDLRADFNLQIPKVPRVITRSDNGNIWVQDLDTDLNVAVNGKKAIVTVLNVKGSVNVAANSGNITLEMPDKTPLKAKNRTANTFLTFLGKNPGEAHLYGEDGQCIVYISKQANATIEARIHGAFTSNLTPQQWAMGRSLSKDEPIKVKLGSGEAKIDIIQKKGELIFDKEPPKTLLSKMTPEPDKNL